MKGNKLLIISILILSVTIIFGSVWIGNSIKSTNKQTSNHSLSSNKALLTVQEVAEYLNIPQDKLKKILYYEEIERQNYTSSIIYRYLPYIEFDEVKYFMKEHIDEWLKYHSNSRSQFSTNH